VSVNFSIYSYIQGVGGWLGVGCGVGSLRGMWLRAWMGFFVGMSSFLKKRKKMYSGISVFFFVLLRNNNGLKKKFKRGTLNLKKKFKTNAILGRQMN
jgi:hypothetical protein